MSEWTSNVEEYALKNIRDSCSVIHTLGSSLGSSRVLLSSVKCSSVNVQPPKCASTILDSRFVISAQSEVFSSFPSACIFNFIVNHD